MSALDFASGAARVSVLSVTLTSSGICRSVVVAHHDPICCPLEEDRGKGGWRKLENFVSSIRPDGQHRAGDVSFRPVSDISDRETPGSTSTTHRYRGGAAGTASPLSPGAVVSSCELLASRGPLLPASPLLPAYPACVSSSSLICVRMAWMNCFYSVD